MCTRERGSGMVRDRDIFVLWCECVQQCTDSVIFFFLCQPMIGCFGHSPSRPWNNTQNISIQNPSKQGCPPFCILSPFGNLAIELSEGYNGCIRNRCLQPLTNTRVTSSWYRWISCTRHYAYSRQDPLVGTLRRTTTRAHLRKHLLDCPQPCSPKIFAPSTAAPAIVTTLATSCRSSCVNSRKIMRQPFTSCYITQWR